MRKIKRNEVQIWSLTSKLEPPSLMQKKLFHEFTKHSSNIV
jgi:hypothetical protein